MQHHRPFRFHEKRRLLNRIVADRDNQIRAIDRPMDVVALRQRRGAHVEVRPAGHGALAHLRIEERNLHPPDQIRQRI
jgi:hypothetical protein